jgi:hypothetical protein
MVFAFPVDEQGTSRIMNCAPLIRTDSPLFTIVLVEELTKTTPNLDAPMKWFVPPIELFLNNLIRTGANDGKHEKYQKLVVDLSGLYKTTASICDDSLSIS